MSNISPVSVNETVLLVNRSWKYSWGEAVTRNSTKSGNMVEPRDVRHFTARQYVYWEKKKIQALPVMRVITQEFESIAEKTASLSILWSAGMVGAQPILVFDLVSRRRGQCTTQARFRSLDPPWPVSLQKKKNQKKVHGHWIVIILVLWCRWWICEPARQWYTLLIGDGSDVYEF